MRITRLVLDRYGHLSDLALAFPPDSGLHVVLGPNEAGKSTTLAAVGDALFGFPHVTPYAFVHATRDLRVTIGLRGEDGRERLFVRIKRNQNDLLDADGRPMAESALAALLGGVTRERFGRVFGLDGAALRAGGQAILQGRGDLSESILQARTGLTGLRALADRLGEEAGRLFGTRHGRRVFHVAVDTFKTERERVEARIVPPAAFARARDEAERLVADRDAAAGEARALHAERARLARIEATAPARAALARDLPELAALGDVPSLPPDAEAQWRDARTASERAAHDLERERLEAAALRTERDALVIDAALLAEGAAIDALAADRSRVQAAEREREPQRVAEAQAARALQDAAQRLGRADDPHALVARIPDALARDAVARAASAYDRLATRRQDAEAAADDAARAVVAAAARVATLPEPPPFAELRAAITAARAEGRLDAERDEAARVLAAASAALATALAALPLWDSTADALAAAPVPLDSDLAAAADRLRAAEAALRVARDAIARRDEALVEIAAELQGYLATGEVPTEAAISAARDRRDRAWRLLRRRHIEGGAAPSPEELADLGEASALPATFEALLHAADALADHRAGDLARVVAYDKARARDAQERVLRTHDAVAEQAAVAARDAARADWAALWRPAGVIASDPDSMRDWLRRREEVLSKRLAVQEAQRRCGALAARHASVSAALAALLPEEAAPHGGRLAALLDSAERVCAARETAYAAWTAAQKELATAEAEAAKQRIQTQKVEAALTAWWETWRAATAPLALRPDAPVESAKLALQLWAEIDRLADQWRAARNRIEQMTLAVRADAEAVTALVARVAPDLDPAGPHEAVRSLAARLDAARKADARRRELDAFAQKSAARVAALEHQHDVAESTLAALRRLAGAADDAALQEAIRRAAAHAALAQRIRERETELHRLGEGKSRAELDAEAADIDPDSLRPRIAEIDRRLADMATESDVRSGRLAVLRAELAAMERGHDAPEAAQAMRDALAQAEEAAARYVRVRLAQTLLNAGIERFRRRSQGPLLARAGALFADLTEGRYVRLDVDADDKGDPLVTAVRGDGGSCAVERLSDGTRDQLYLALRLAAIAGEAGTGESLPLIADDLLVNFDDRRARAALRVLAAGGPHTQTILFTHHAHIAAMAEEDGIAPVLRLPAGTTVTAA